MKSALTRWAFSVAFGLIVSAVGISTHDRSNLGRLVHGDNNTVMGPPTAWTADLQGKASGLCF